MVHNECANMSVRVTFYIKYALWVGLHVCRRLSGKTGLWTLCRAAAFWQCLLLGFRVVTYVLFMLVLGEAAAQLLS